ncbi:MAG TPA: hypothetical protein VHM20_02590, partial [Gammaproteobacteria bacterium]|nr:hypothetical protein [Gammaproteobacteria bacterium]
DQNVLNVIEQCLKELKSQKIDTVLISCGLDAHQDDKLGQGEGTGIALTDEFYKNILAKVQTYFPGASLSIFLEGGYNVKVIERTFENILNHLVKQRKLTEQQSVLPYSVFASEPAHQGESSDSHHNHRKNGR